MNRLCAFFERRLHLRPLLEAARQQRTAAHRPLGDAPPISPGRLTLLLVGVQFLTGLALTFFYIPSAEHAAASLAILHRDRPLGWLLHNTHRWTALILLVMVVLHALRVWLMRAYRFPRDVNWWLGVGLLLLILALGGSGYLLRWDIKAFALMDLIISNLGGVPGIGRALVGFILGSIEPEVVPLYRGYMFHVWFFPLALILLIGTHLFIVWQQGLFHTSELWERLRRRLPVRRWVDFLPGVLMLLVLLLLSLLTPHEGQAGPDERFPWPHPDWLLMFYFLPFWFFKGRARIWGALILPGALLVFLMAAPRLGAGKTRRSLVWGLAAFGVVGVLWLFSQMSLMGYQVPLQGCNACHRPTIVGGAPFQLSQFQIRDPDWLVFHLQDPQGSLLVPFTEPFQEP